MHVVFLLLFICIPSLAFAAELEDFYRMNQIVIRSERLDETEGMLSYGVVGEEDIKQKQQQGRGVAGLTSDMPNVDSVGSPRSSAQEFKIRGLDDTRIVVKVDGTKSDFRGEYKGRNFISPYFLGEVGVKRGASSVLDGAGGIAGSVSLNTKEVEDFASAWGAPQGGELGARYESNANVQNYTGAAFAKEGALGLLGMYSFSKNNNFIAGGEVLPYSNNTENNVMLKGKYEFSPQVSVKLTGTMFTEKGETTSNPFRLTDAGEGVEKTLTTSRIAAEGVLKDFTLRVFYEELGAKEALLEGERVDKTDFSSVGVEALREAVVYNKNGVKNTLIYGLEFYRDTQDGVREGAGRENLYPAGSFRTEGIYLQNALKYHDFGLLLGIRGDHYNLSSLGQEMSRDSGVLKKAVLSYDITDWLTPYLRYSEGYRAPLIKEAYASGSILSTPGFSLNLAANAGLKAEEARNYEAGFSILHENILMPNDELKFSANYFVNDISNYITQDPNCTVKPGACGFFPSVLFTFQYQNISKARLKGFELEGKYNSKNYHIYLSYAQTKGKDLQNDTPLLGILPAKFVASVTRKLDGGFYFGSRITAVAAFTEDDLRNYVISLGPVTSSLNAVDLRLAQLTSGYAIFDFYAGKEFGKFGAGIGLYNAFNKDYFDQTSFVQGLGRSIVIYGQMRI